MKYLVLPYAMWSIYSRHFAAQLARMLPHENQVRVMQAAKKDYKRIVSSIPDFDADDDMRMTILNAALFISIYKNLEEKPDVEIAKGYYSASMLDSFITRFFFKNKGLFTAKYQEKLRASAEKSMSRNNPFTWKYAYKAGDDIDSFSAYYYQCGICRLAGMEHVTEVVPALCAFDYPMAGLMGSSFHRDTTLASGGDRCDCRYAKL
jgi:hypothetical protein